MQLAVPREIMPGENRVALVPESVGRLVTGGHSVLVETDAGSGAYYPDDAYQRAGAEIMPNSAVLYDRAQIIIKIRPPSVDSGRSVDEVARLRSGSILIGVLQPLANPLLMRRLADNGVTCLSLDSLPRITRAQSMDVLSSMSTVSGYQAAVLAAARLPKFFPLLMTAAGTVTPARVLVLGAGVAGLQAIATARRLGAVVQAFDTRPAAGEQVESLGASFLTLPLQVRDAEDIGGYARQMSEDIYAHERDLLCDPVRDADVVITTAMIPGATAPRLISTEMVAAMRPGSVIVDLASEAGGNCDATVAGQEVIVNGVRIIAPLNLPATIPVHASQLYSRNIAAFVTHLTKNGWIADTDAGRGGQLNLDDEIIRSTCITHAGDILHQATRERAEQAAIALTR